MATHLETGKTGEDLAAAWLIANQYTILYRNWRYGHYEIDIIALKENILCFIEVKCLHSTEMGYPEDKVTRKKFRNIQFAADHYLRVHPGYKWIQYHILSITLYKDREPEYFLLEDVYL
jgi:putative endonuclease